MSNIVKFNNQNLELIKYNGQWHMTQRQIAVALDFKSSVGVSDLYNSHKSEFTEEMSCLIKQGRTRIRIFNRDGAWLIGMFARTPKAAEFRQWVLKVLNYVSDNQGTLKQVQSDKLSVEVREHVRRLPSGKKEIVLSEKEHKAIGGIVKSCTAVAVREELKNLQNKEYDRDSVSKAFDSTTEEMIAEKQRERKQYMLSEAEVDIIEKIRSANAFNMLKMYMGVSDKLANNRF